MIPIPSNNVWKQLNISDVLGDIWASFNIDLTENEGKLRLGKALIKNTNTTDVAAITSYPAAFRIFNTYKYALAGTGGTGYLFYSTSPYPSDAPFAQLTGSNTPSGLDSRNSDMEIFNNSLYVSSASGTIYWNNGSWQSSFNIGGSYTSDVNPHILTPYNSRMYMTVGGNSVVSWSTSNVVANSGTYTLSLDASLTTTFIRSASNRIWIGTISNQNNKGYIFEWDGVSSSPTKSYILESQGALACVIKDDVPYIMDFLGNLLVWNGGTFKKVAGLNRVTNKMLYNGSDTANRRWIHPNGMAIIKNRINILIDGRYYDGSTFHSVETIPSGIWEYDESHGLYHKHSFGGSYGSVRIGGGPSSAGAGALVEDVYGGSSSNGSFLAGVSYYSDATTAISGGIFYNDLFDTTQKCGYIITSKVTADDGSPYHTPTVQSMWQSFYTMYKPLLNASDRIVLKYRTSEVEPTEMTITWTSATTFTTTDANIANYAKGDEVEVTQGVNGGLCSHIVSIVNNSGTYTVTVDETYPSTSGTALARLQYWKKIGSIIKNNQNFNSDTISIPSTWIQFKIMPVFTGREEIERLLITNENFTPAK